ncbi:hypothetical protein TNCT6_32590 [Streptomyces sp. 6-11-2]|nr:hypothetical protein TNCT6_32590 [Streptomyces sp. 6-11-2]
MDPHGDRRTGLPVQQPGHVLRQGEHMVAVVAAAAGLTQLGGGPYELPNDAEGVLPQ